MSNKTVYVPYEKEVTVTEHRAPTTASARFLKELEDQAELNIIDSLIISDNIINGAIVAFATNTPQCSISVHFKFKLNDKEFKGDFDVLREDLWKESLREILYRETSKTLAAMFMRKYSEIMPEIRSNLG